MKKFAVVLSGSGVYDGAEIHESTLTLYAIIKQGASYEIFAPNIPQHHVINHITGEEMNESRNVLVESARIARGAIRDIKEYNAGDFDGLIFPGGFGVAKNLSTVAFDGSEAKVNDDISAAVKSTHELGKPIGALCIAPAMMAKILGNAIVTIGQDPATIEAIEKMGGTHISTTHGDVVYDDNLNLFSTPCYMLDANILQIGEGAENIVSAMLKVM
ncbi:MAG TPA: isoprenoid biosynthesis glyoxalase ElbB [Bacteroidales bacterium]|nr:isoprenoid biosynthesis glyoxalase ElbB [Bacteroidales bacterium]